MSSLLPLMSAEPESVWSTISWARIDDPADRNMDLLPDWFRIDFGCPECGSAWVDLLAAGYTRTRSVGGWAWWSEKGVGGMRIESAPFREPDFRAARIGCCEGHTYELDSYTHQMRKRELPSWSAAGIGLGVLAIAGLAYVVAGGRK